MRTHPLLSNSFESGKENKNKKAVLWRTEYVSLTSSDWILSRGWVIRYVSCIANKPYFINVFFYLMDLSQTYFSTEITAETLGELFFIPVGLQLSWRNKKTSLSPPLPACETVTSLWASWAPWGHFLHSSEHLGNWVEPSFLSFLNKDFTSGRVLREDNLLITVTSSFGCARESWTLTHPSGVLKKPISSRRFPTATFKETVKMPSTGRQQKSLIMKRI